MCDVHIMAEDWYYHVFQGEEDDNTRKSLTHTMTTFLTKHLQKTALLNYSVILKRIKHRIKSYALKQILGLDLYLPRLHLIMRLYIYLKKR